MAVIVTWLIFVIVTALGLAWVGFGGRDRFNQYSDLVLTAKGWRLWAFAGVVLAGCAALAVLITGG